jgi:uncharacterized FlaG/YvyC family protein
MRDLKKEIKAFLKSLDLAPDFEIEERNGKSLVTVYEVPPEKMIDLCNTKPDDVIIRLAYR